MGKGCRTRTPSRPLAPTVRSELEGQLGSDLGHVRVHEGPIAHQAAAAVHAPTRVRRGGYRGGMTSASPGAAPLTTDRRAVLHRRVRWIVAGTITYNVLEAVIALTAGTIASSAALIGFGLDSIVEVLSAAAVAWLLGLAVFSSVVPLAMMVGRGREIGADDLQYAVVLGIGGALAAPGWADVCDWWTDLDQGSRLVRDYAFLAPAKASAPGAGGVQGSPAPDARSSLTAALAADGISL